MSEVPPENSIDVSIARVSGYNIAWRALTTVAATLGKHALAILIGIVVARTLGPVQFGVYTFLLAGFASLHTLLDLGISQGFFTFVCKEPWSRRIYAAYGLWLAAQFLLPAVIITAILPQGWVVDVWRGESRFVILLALLASYSQRVLWQAVVQIYEAQRKTVQVQLATVAIMVAQLLCVLVFWYLNIVTISVLFWAVAAQYLFAASFLLARRFVAHIDPLNTESVGSVAMRMIIFVAPLMPSIVLQMANTLGETWLLQIFSGPVQQGYFGLAQQYANIGLVFGFASLNVFWKELAAAYGREDIGHLRQIYIAATRILYILPVSLAAFCVFWATSIIKILLGSSYEPVGEVFVATLLTSVSQCVGAVMSIFYVVTNRTKIWSVFSAVYVAVSAPASVFALWYLKGGALGLAFKLTVLSTAFTLWYDWYICRQYGWKTDNVFRLGLGIFLFAAGYVAHAVTLWIGAVWPVVGQLIFGLALYGLIVVPGLAYGTVRLGYDAHLRKFFGKLA